MKIRTNVRARNHGNTGIDAGVTGGGGCTIVAAGFGGANYQSDGDTYTVFN